MIERWKAATAAYTRRLAEGGGVGFPAAAYRRGCIRDADERRTAYTETELQAAADELEAFLASEEGKLAEALLVASERDVLLGTFTDEDLTFVYQWDGGFLSVFWFPTRAEEGPLISACCESGFDAPVSAREIVELLTAQRPPLGVLPRQIIPYLRKAITEIANAAPGMEPAPAKEVPALHIVK